MAHRNNIVHIEFSFDFLPCAVRCECEPPLVVHESFFSCCKFIACSNYPFSRYYFAAFVIFNGSAECNDARHSFSDCSVLVSNQSSTHMFRYRFNATGIHRNIVSFYSQSIQAAVSYSFCFRLNDSRTESARFKCHANALPFRMTTDVTAFLLVLFRR